MRRVVISSGAIVLGLLCADAAAQPRVHVETEVRGLSFAATGDYIAVGHGAGGIAGAVSVYSMKRPTRKAINLPALAKPVTEVVFVDNGNYVAAIDEAGLVVAWAWPDLREVFTIDLQANRKPATAKFRLIGNPNGPQLAWVEVGNDKLIEVAELPSGRVVTSISKVVTTDQQVAWSRDGNFLIVGGSLWNWDTFASWRAPEAGRSAISNDGATLVFVPRKKCTDIALVDIASGKIMRRIELGEVSCPRHMWFEGKTLVWLASVGGADKPTYSAYSWDAKRDRIKRLRQGLPASPVIAISPNGKQVVLGSGQSARFTRLR